VSHCILIVSAHVVSRVRPSCLLSAEMFNQTCCIVTFGRRGLGVCTRLIFLICSKTFGVQDQELHVWSQDQDWDLVNRPQDSTAISVGHWSIIASQGIWVIGLHHCHSITELFANSWEIDFPIPSLSVLVAAHPWEDNIPVTMLLQFLVESGYRNFLTETC